MNGLQVFRAIASQRRVDVDVAIPKPGSGVPENRFASVGNRTDLLIADDFTELSDHAVYRQPEANSAVLDAADNNMARPGGDADNNMARPGGDDDQMASPPIVADGHVLTAVEDTVSQSTEGDAERRSNEAAEPGRNETDDRVPNEPLPARIDQTDILDTPAGEVLRFRGPPGILARSDSSPSIEERVLQEMSKLSELEKIENVATRDISSVDDLSDLPQAVLPDEPASHLSSSPDKSQMTSRPVEKPTLLPSAKLQTSPSLTIGSITINADNPPPQNKPEKKSRAPDVSGQLRRIGFQRL